MVKKYGRYSGTPLRNSKEKWIYVFGLFSLEQGIHWDTRSLG